MAEAKFYVYVHREADSGRVFYVGKGSGKRANDRNRRSALWKSIAAKHGLIVQIVSEALTERQAFHHERVLILLHSLLGSRLANFTEGGEGCSGYRFSDEQRIARNAKIKEAHGRQEVKERKAIAISAALKGKTFSAERRAILSRAKKGKPLSPEHRAALKGKVITEQHRAALKAANARPEVRVVRSAKIAASMKGRIKSDEHRANLARASKEDWARRKAAKAAKA